MDINRPLTLDIVREDLAEKGYCLGRPDPEAYQNWKKLLPGCISYSMLKDFAKSPFAFHYEQVHGERKVTPAMQRGSLVDCLALTPELFAQRYLVESSTSTPAAIANLTEILANCGEVLPDTVCIAPYRVRLRKDGAPYANNEQDPTQKAAWEAMQAKGITVYSEDDLAEARRLLDLKRRNITRITPSQEAEARAISAATSAALKHHFPQGYTTQVAMYLRVTHAPDGSVYPAPLTLCCLADIWPTRGETGAAALADLKLTEANLHVDRKLAWNIHDMGYEIQAGMESICYQAIFGEPLETFSFLCQSPHAPFEDKLVELNRYDLDDAESYVDHLLKDYSAALALGNFGSPHLGKIAYAATLGKDNQPPMDED